MNKSELIQAVAAAADLNQVVAGKAVNAVIDTITESLKTGETVTLVGFGTFCVKDRAERTGRNPATGKPITIAASKVPAFKVGKVLKDAVAG